MSTIPILKDVSQLYKAHQALSQEVPNTEHVLNQLPQHLKDRMANFTHPEELSRAKQLLLSIRDLTHEIYTDQPENIKARIHTVFYRCCNRDDNLFYNFCGMFNTTLNCWGRNHIKDTDKIDSLFKSLELIFVEKETLAWAGDEPNRKYAAQKILNFMNSPSETKLDLSRLFLGSLPDIFDNNEMKNRLTELKLSFEHLQSLPESIDYLTSSTSLGLIYNHLDNLRIYFSAGHQLRPPLDSMRRLLDSMMHLPTNCEVYIQDSGFARYVLAPISIINLILSCENPEYTGDKYYVSIQDHDVSILDLRALNGSLRALCIKAEIQGCTSLETTYPRIKKCVTLKHQKANSLQGWLSRLSIMQKSGGESSRGLSRKVLSYLDLAEQDEAFREQFFITIEGATATCGDRMALSVLHLGLQHKMTVFDKSDLRGYAEFLIHGPWMLDRLEEVAREKVQTLPSVDEIEVYLGYPVKLRERLNLQIDVEDMLYFACSGITEADLDNAASYIEQQVLTLEAKANILAQREDWVEALRQNSPEVVEEYETQRRASLESSDYSDIDMHIIQERYMSNLASLTKRFL